MQTGSLPLFFFDKNVTGNLGIIRYYKTKVLVLVISAHQPAHSAKQHSDDFAFPSSASARRQNLRFHRIQQKSIRRIFRRNIQVVFESFRLYKAEARPVADKGSDNQGILDLISSCLRFCNSSLGEQVVQAPFEEFPAIVRHLHHEDQFLFFHRYIGGISHERQDFVLACFPSLHQGSYGFLLLCQGAMMFFDRTS